MRSTRRDRSMADILREAVATIRVAAQPRQFGFVNGHAYLDGHALRSIKQVVDTENPIRDRQLLAEYEMRFATLVGDGKAASFASARMAFYALMRVLGIGPGDEVVLPAFTCAVMPNAVMRAGARPVYADIDPHTLGSSAQAIEKVLTGCTKLIVAQHSFGIPCAIDAIVDLAGRQAIRVVEDCAIALDSSLRGTTVGNWGDAALFSTDHSKPLNTMVGGVLYTRHLDIFNKMSDFSRDLPTLSSSHQKRLYRQLTAERRIGDPEQYPRIHFRTKMRLLFDRLTGANHATFLENDSGPGQPATPAYPYPATLPPFLAQLGILELQRWPEEKLGRKLALARLLAAAEQSGCAPEIPAAYRDSVREITPLRFAFTLPRRQALLAELDSFVDTGAFWFMQPVIGAAMGPGSMGYAPGSCPIAEKTCASIANLPCAIDSDQALFLEERMRNLGQRSVESRAFRQ